MKTGEARLGITYEKCVGRIEEDRAFLKWRAGRSEDPEPAVLDLSLAGEREFVERELDADIQEGNKRKLDRWRLMEEAGKLLPEERVSRCGKDLVPKKMEVRIFRALEGGGAFYADVKRCGSLWVCPCCAAKISEIKKGELKQVLEICKARGWKVFHLTLTIPHHRGNDTRSLCDQLLKARKVMQNRTWWRNYSKAIGLLGSVRALEVTYGDNGSHVHIHVLLFCMPEQLIPCASDFLPPWRTACLTAGFPDHEINKPGFDLHSVVLQDGSYAAKYVSKWGLDCEMTKAHIKKGNGSSRTAFDLLRAAADGDVDAGRLFQEHARAFKCRRQLVWSKGLRALLGLGVEKSDEELAEEQTETAEEITTVGWSDWQRVLQYKVRGDLLIVAETDGAEGVKRFLWGLRDRRNRRERQVWRN